MIYTCCDELRRNALRGSAVNGIDFLEVLDSDAPTPALRQRRLVLHLVNPLTGGSAKTHFLIEGGERVTGVQVTALSIGVGPQANVVTLDVDPRGDFSRYTLRIVKDAAHPEPPDGFDPQLSSVAFFFKAECESDFDCQPQRSCPPPPHTLPEIDYLAKDYASFRQLMLDRLALLLPDWQERNAADLGIVLVELLAYVGDYLSYQQDAVSTEAYLGTARRRVSARRHARLVDYFLNDGCNARAWVQLQVDADVIAAGPNAPPAVPRGTPLFTHIPGQPVHLPDDPLVLRQAHVVFETMEDVTELLVAHNELKFYTWGDGRCCLSRGTTHATLKGNFTHLKAGNVLIFEEVLGPDTGRLEDADPARRQAVRLTQVVFSDAKNKPLVDPLTQQPITEIVWDADDALPFPLCISSRTDADHGGQYLDNVSVARGNIVLADRGQTIRDEALGTVSEAPLYRPPPPGQDRCVENPPVPVPPRFRPELQQQPLTQAAVYNAAASASAAMRWQMRDVLPAVLDLTGVLKGQPQPWSVKRDLLRSAADSPDFVAEAETDGTVTLRFGDDRFGMRPDAGTRFTASYRVGNGTDGNIGAEALVHILLQLPHITRVRNPLPAQGGVEPESIEDVRQRAPSAFRTQERAVTPADYAAVAERDPRIQRAAATFRWTGSWHTVFLSADRLGGLAVDEPFKKDLRIGLERYRMAGYDLEIDSPRFVALEIDMAVCARPDYFRSHVKQALLELFSNRVLPDRRLGVFHSDNFSFGEPVYLSRLYSKAQGVPGVSSVRITTFQRLGQDDLKPLDDGMILLGPLEIARCDNDPNFPERGIFRLDVGGGK
jgi:hypothetical protein